MLLSFNRLEAFMYFFFIENHKLITHLINYDVAWRAVPGFVWSANNGNRGNKLRIWETLNLSTNADSSSDTMSGDVHM